MRRSFRTSWAGHAQRPGVLVETDIARSLNKPTIQVLSQRARRSNFRGVPHVEEHIPWKWNRINKRLDELGE